VASAGLAPAHNKAHVDGRTLVCVDESGLYLVPGRLRTYAPGGQTPLLRWPSTRDHGSVMRGITLEGRRDTMVREEALDSLDRVVCLKHLLPHVSARWLVRWDGSPLHKGPVRSCLAAGGAQPRHMAQLPA
jgi:hypothetical protein